MIGSIATHSIPVSGIYNAHLWESGLGRVRAMRPRDILAENLKTLMAAKGMLFPEITAASSGKLTNGTLDRIRRAKVAVTLDKLGDLAEAFKLEPWQLLVEGLNPEELPRLAGQKLLSEIRELVRSEQATTQDFSEGQAPPTGVQGKNGPSVVGPALKKALVAGGTTKDARSTDVRLPQSRTRGRA